MSIRETEIAERLSNWLDRYAVPMHLRDKPEATQAEAESLARVLSKFAPKTDYVPFLNQVFDEVDLLMKTRAWPTVSEIGAACSNIRKSTRLAQPRADDLDMRPVAIAARRMKRGEPISEAYLWGICAVELIAERLVEKATMDRYRAGMFNHIRDLYGADAAIKWETEAKAQHEAAKAVFRSRNEPRSPRHTVFPDKSAKPLSGTS
jgi:hypothetical protein